jgi:hypothetical protein
MYRHAVFQCRVPHTNENGHQLRMLVVHSRFSNGFHVVMAPAELRDEQIQAALREVGVEAEERFELGGWRTSSQNVAVAHVPVPTWN